MTISLIGINVLAFIAEYMAPDLDAFIQTWALVPSVMNPVTFLTSMFLHGGIAHIGFNMWYLWIFGDNVEGRLGHGWFLLFYLAAGLAAIAAELPGMLGSDIPMLGASGAIAGVLGMYLAFFPHHRVDALIPDFFGFLAYGNDSGVIRAWVLVRAADLQRRRIYWGRGRGRRGGRI